MKSLLLLQCYLLFIGYSWADNDGQCQITGIDDTDYLTVYTMYINDTQIDVSLLETPYTGTLEVQKFESSVNGSYFEVTTEDDNFVIRTTSEFANFDQNTAKQESSVFLVNLECTLQCTAGTSSLTIRVFVTDINTHPPQFNLETYEFKVASPIMPRTDFSIYGDVAIVTNDVDFSNQNVVFTIEPDDFTVTTSSSATSKDYIAIFAAKNVLQLTGNRTYTITATDSGTNPGPLTSSSTVTLILDESISLDTPTFESSSYSFNYSVDGSTPILTVLDGPITITTNKEDSLTDITLTGDYSSYFTASFNSDSSTFDLSATDLLPMDSASFVILTLTVATDNTAATSLIIYLPEEEATLEFSMNYYTASYNAVSNDVTLDNAIEVISTTTPNVSLAGEYAELFDINYDKKTKSYQVTVTSDLTVIEKSKSYITVTLNASVGENYDTAILIVSLPEHTLQFTQSLYTATYNSDETISLNSSSIGFTTDTKGVKIEIGGTYNEYIGIEYNSEKDQWSLVVEKPLSNDTLKTETDLVITLTATDDYDDQAQSVVYIELPKVIADAPTFSDSYYLANYIVKGDTPSISVDEDIIITNRDNQSNIKITLDSYTDYFGISYDKTGNKWVFKVSSSLPDDILLAKKELLITLTAEEENNTNKGKSVVVVDWSTKETLKFSQGYYIGTYPENGTGIIEVQPTIDFTNVEDINNVVISLDSYTDNFGLSYKSNKWTLTINKNLSDSILKSYGELVITLTATEDNKYEDQSILIIELPTVEDAPKFSNAYYVAEYPESGTGTVAFESDISFTNIKDPKNVAITLDKFGENFQITYESNKFQLHVKKSLDDTVLHSNVELVMSLIASEATYEEEGLSALILQLPTAANGTAPKFLDAYYIAEYPENGTGLIEFENPIQFANVDEPTEISINLDKYASNFEIVYHSNRWYININKALEDSVLHTNVELVMALIATTSGSNEVGESALVLKLPTAVFGTAPRFTEAYYLAQYPKNGTGVIEFEKPVAFTNVDDITNIGITVDNYSENLEILYDSNRWYIKIVKSLEEAIIHKNTELVFTLTATEIGNTEKGRSALMLELPSAENDTVIEFSEVYYFARYPINGNGTIELETPLSFKNVDDPQDVEISLSKYSSNFEIKYDGNKWYINITSSLKESVLIENSELVITMTAYKKSEDDIRGYSVLILSLPSPTEAPKFSKAYYMAEYPENGTGIIEFKSPVNFSNVDNLNDVQITLDNYLDYFKIVYSGDRWYINILQSLEDSVLNKNIEIVMTMIATETGHEVEGDAALVLSLPKASIAPEFADAYYLAEYPENGTGSVDFETPIAFLNVKDPTTISISLDRYSSNFDIKYSSKGWYINIKDNLEESVLNENADLVITLIATEIDNKNKGYAVLVLKLPAAAKVAAPEFAEAYYIANYPESGNGTIEFENPINFLNVDDLEKLKLTVDTYTDNFEITYASGTWNIKINNALDDDILTKNVELVMTMIATETVTENVGYTALVLKLPSAVNGTAIKFSEAYYTAEYPINGKGTAVDIKNPIQFLNVDDIKSVTISLDTYQDNFNITYSSKKWVLNVNQPLDDDTLNNNNELVITLVATNIVDKTEARAALVLKLPTETSPIFSEAYYTAEYSEDVKDVIEFDNAISFKNIDDSSKITIKLDKYTDYFDITLLSNTWVIQIKKILEDSILNENNELEATLIATEDNNKNEGYSALVLKLPTTNAKEAPEFSKILYTASYTSDADKSSVIISDAINITNKEDLNKIEITVDNYQENFNVIYDSSTNSWIINVLKPISESILISKTDLIIPLTATDTTNNLKGYSVIDLTLPAVDSKTAPLFSNTYYTGKYEYNGETPLVKLDTPINITNKDDLTNILISIENYADNFKMQYVAESNEWKMDVVKNLNESVLNSKMDLVMTLTAIDTSSNEVGRCTLVLTLPIVNSDDAPKFSSIYYLGEYDTNDAWVTVNLDDSIKITNKNDLTKVKINVDDSYKDNFEINYDTDSSKWLLNVKTALNETITKGNMELVLTLTATETDNTNIGQAALVLEFGNSRIAPKFSHAHYSGEYLVDDDQATVILNDTITVVNKENLADISVTLDSYDSNFKIDYDPTNQQWILSVIYPILEDDLESNSELIITLTAKEEENDNTGESTLILALPSSHNNSTEEVVKFSQVHYVASYHIEGEKGVVEMNDIIKVESEVDLTNLVVTLENEEYAEYFQIVQESDTYVVTVQTSLPSTILSTLVSLPLTLIAEVDDNKAYATLVINLPAAVTEHSIQFSQPLYEGTYQVTEDGTVTFQVSGSIEVETEAEDANIETRITSTTGYEEYFGLSYSSNVLTIVKTQDLPESALRSSSVIPLILTAGISGTTDSSSAVLNILIDFSDDESATAVAFRSVLYSGKYEVTDGTGVFTVDDEITVITDEPDSNVEVIVTNEYSHYFTASYSNKVVTVELSQPLSTDIVNTTTFIPVTLQLYLNTDTRVITGTSLQESAVLNVKIIYNGEEDPGLIQFSTVLYTGTYTIEDGKGQLVLNENILVITDAEDDQIEASISDGSDYAKYFAVTYNSNTVSVELVNDVPEDILTSTTLMALTLTIGITGTTHRSSSVLNIVIDDNDETRDIEFSDVLYNGKYVVTDGKGYLTIDDDITIITNESDRNIEVTISNEYDSYFATSYSNKVVIVILKKQLSTEILNSSSIVPIVLEASIAETSYQASAVLNIILYYEGENNTGFIEFSSVLYNAEYSITDEEVKFYLDEDIKVMTDRTDEEIETSISKDSEYSKFFTISYSSKVVAIKLKENLPEDVLTENSFIALTLIVSITGTTHRSSAVLNIDIYNDGDDSDSKNCDVPEMQTVYISVISILSILLIALIAAALAFYFLRIRKRNYSNLEEEDGKVRFNKKSLNRSSSDIRPATSLDERRPTGFIFNPISEDSIDGTDSIGEPEKSRRKSVAFDDNVEKLQIDASNEDDNVSEDDNTNNNPEITHA